MRTLAPAAAAEELRRLYAEFRERVGPDDRDTLHCRSDLALACDVRVAADERIARGEVGPLEGIPIAVKDLLCTVGQPTTCGSRMLEGWLPLATAENLAHEWGYDGPGLERLILHAAPALRQAPTLLAACAALWQAHWQLQRGEG